MVVIQLNSTPVIHVITQFIGFNSNEKIIMIIITF